MAVITRRAGCFAAALPLGERERLAMKSAALRSPRAYPEPTRTVSAIETHFALVFLTDEYAYKLKKPLRTDAFDLRTIGARRRSCTAEVRLNRRLAPDVYLGVAPLTLSAQGEIRVAGRGRTIDYLVRMRRLPAALMLDCTAQLRAPPADRLRALGRTLAKFYAGQPPQMTTSRTYIAHLARCIARDSAELSIAQPPLMRERIREVEMRQLSALDRRAPLLEARARARRIVEAHGDLRPEHVCLTEPPRVIDCLEFSRALRTLDAAEELAFFALECERIGAAEAAQRTVEGYCSASGDRIPPAIFDFYRSRRALVRARLAARRWREERGAASASWAYKASRYVDAADRYARRALYAAPSAGELADRCSEQRRDRQDFQTL